MADAIEIHKILVLSTAHMTQADAELATEQVLAPCMGVSDEGFIFRAALTNEYGQLDPVCMLNDACENGYSEDLQRVLLYAVSLRCKYVLLDRDAGRAFGLEVFEW